MTTLTTLDYADVCLFCGEEIRPDFDKDNKMDWGNDGDYGCGEHPLSDEEGTMGHRPSSRIGVALNDASEDAWDKHRNTDAYVEAIQGALQKFKRVYK